jgi:2-methylisocitrate lyase-like PEP mutase family enzyme
MVRNEYTMPIWFALRLSPTTFGVLDAFHDEQGRQARLGGPIAQALMAKVEELFAEPPIEAIQVRGLMSCRKLSTPPLGVTTTATALASFLSPAHRITLMRQADLYERFVELHSRPRAFVMPNAWDGISALVLKREGFEALGTSSLAIASALGRRDGLGEVSRDEALANAVLLSKMTGLPVNGDLENGFGDTPENCRITVDAAVAAGLAGLGIEDTTGNPTDPIYDFDLAVARIAAAARAAKGRIVLTARTDNFLQGRPDLEDTIRRLTAFAEVGADVLYAPGLPNMDAIRAVVEAVAPKPVNVVVSSGWGSNSLAMLDALGVRRVSLGSALYRCAMRTVQNLAKQVSGGVLDTMGTGLPAGELTAWIGEARTRQ